MSSLSSSPTVVVCVNWIDLHPEVDALTGSVTTDERRGGFSDADRAALEVGLRLADARDGTVTIVSVAPSTADGALLELAASGAMDLIRIDGDPALGAAAIGRALAESIAHLHHVEAVLCGDLGSDWGSGAVPGYLAHHLGLPQALGVVEITSVLDPIGVVRRLDGGRREVLSLAGPAVISVEGAVALLRRAPLRTVMEWRRRGVHVGGHAHPATTTMVAEVSGPIRPRARSFAPPHSERALDRIVELTGALVERTPPRTVDVGPAEAAAVIVEQLTAWGYLES